MRLTAGQPLPTDPDWEHREQLTETPGWPPRDSCDWTESAVRATQPRVALPREVTMTGRTQAALTEAPEWMSAEMPPAYQTRLWEIQRMSAELHAMDRIGRVLWETGEPLRDAVGAVFSALKCEVDATPGSDGPIVVKLGDSRRLLLVVSGATNPIQKSDEELARVFRAVQFAAGDDRVVYVANNDPATPPADRPDPVLPDALGVLHKIGADVVTTATLFRLWRLSYEDQQKARKVLDRLHAQDGGLFIIPSR
jgi:hypothetical protein